MPLTKSRGPAAFKSNGKEMIKNHPQDVPLAAAFRIKRDAARRADGGSVNNGFTSNFDQASKYMSLTPQEQNLYQHHLNNLTGRGKVVNDDGSTSPIYQAVQPHEGKNS